MGRLMTKNELVDRLTSGAMTRRQLGKVLASAGLAMASMPLHSRRSFAAADLTVATWAGYDDPALYPKFLAEHGEAPNWVIFQSQTTIFEKLRSGLTADTVHPGSYWVRQFRDADLIVPVDTSRVTEWPNVLPNLKLIEGVNDGDATFMVPIEWGYVSLIHRTDIVQASEPSWNLLWDAAYKGKTSSKDDFWTVIIAALTKGVPDPFNMSEAELESVGNRLRELRENVRFFWTDQTTLYQSIADGEVVAAATWSDALPKLIKQGVPVKWLTPKEGNLNWVSGICRLKNGEGNEDLVYDYIDAMLDPTVGEYLVTAWGFGHSNKKTFDIVSAETLQSLGLSDPEGILKSGVFLAGMSGETRTSYETVFENVKAGL